MKTVAVIGTGIMGRGMALNFLKNKYKVIVWNRSKSRLHEFKNKGAQIAETPKKATQNADIIFEVTANDQSSEAVWLGKDGILEGADKKKVLIASGTFSVEWIDKLAQICSKKGYTFFDMPLTGGRQGAEEGKLILLLGGDPKKLKGIQKDLSAIAQKVLYFGKAGSGMRFKLILNTLQAIHMQGLGEMLRIAKQAGLDVKTVGDALAQRPGGTTTQLAWRDFQKEPKPINFALKWITKDVMYTKELAAKLDTPLIDEAIKRFKKGLKNKMGERDWTSINKLN